MKTNNIISINVGHFIAPHSYNSPNYADLKLTSDGVFANHCDGTVAVENVLEVLSDLEEPKQILRSLINQIVEKTDINKWRISELESSLEFAEKIIRNSNNRLTGADSPLAQRNAYLPSECKNPVKQKAGSVSHKSEVSVPESEQNTETTFQLDSNEQYSNDLLPQHKKTQVTELRTKKLPKIYYKSLPLIGDVSLPIQVHVYPDSDECYLEIDIEVARKVLVNVCKELRRD
jgi:hypothetical protein